MSLPLLPACGFRVTLDLIASGPVPQFIKHFSCSTEVCMKFKLLINADIAKIN